MKKMFTAQGTKYVVLLTHLTQRLVATHTRLVIEYDFLDKLAPRGTAATAPL